MNKIFLTTAVLAAVSGHARRADACGCFAQPTVVTTASEPVVQAGERILFSIDQGMVTAYIQIKYKGSASQFGWLVPLPSVPTLQLGTDELFGALQATTSPVYTLTTTRNLCAGGSSSSSSSLGGCGASNNSAGNGGNFGADDGGHALGDAGSSEVVAQSSIGPFDYVVLHADDQTEMLSWLSTNQYYVPTGTDAVLQPYVHPGAYFLALKLRAGESSGDIVPVIVKYASDLPMIPLILTSVGAVPDMGIQVWVLGGARAIPRNYRQVVVDDMPIWLGTESYQSLLIRAIREAPDRHAFVTEYAGSSQPMVGVLDPPGRFGTPLALKGFAHPSDYLQYLQSQGFLFDSTLIALLEKYLPIPAQFQTVPPAVYYQGYDYYQSQLGTPDGGVPPAFDASALTDEIEARIVQPTLATGQLFRAHPYLTRLYTALSPEDMTADPVFSENPDLPNVSLAHSATATIPCKGSPYVVSDQTMLQSQIPGRLTPATPASLRIETLREAGQPIVDTDNQATIEAALGPVDHGSNNQGGCALAFPRAERGMLLLLVAALILARRTLRRRAGGAR